MNTDKLKELIEQIKQEYFKNPTDTSDAEVLGIVIANHFKWNGYEIMEAFQSALTDSNFHTEAKEIENWM